MQSYIAGLSTARPGTLMALGMSGMNLGVAASSSLAAFAYAHDALWVAAQGAVLLFVAIVALRPIAMKGREAVWPKHRLDPWGFRFRDRGWKPLPLR